MTDAVPPGFYIERVFAQQLVFEGVSQTAELPENFAVEYAWEWTPVDEQSFFVVLAARGIPGKDRPEMVTVSMAGKFRREGSPERPPFIDFLKVNATTILVPYVREAFSNLTGRGLKGAFTLGPLNVIQMMSTIRFETSVGASRLSQMPELVGAYNIPPDVLALVGEDTVNGRRALTSG